MFNFFKKKQQEQPTTVRVPTALDHACYILARFRAIPEDQQEDTAKMVFESIYPGKHIHKNPAKKEMAA